MREKLRTVRWKFVGVILFAAALIVITFVLVDSVLTDRRQAQRQTIIDNYERTESIDRVQEKVFAEAYWRRNPDVAADAFFGIDGALGVFGPREHFNRYGRVEGRVWGP